MQAGFKTDQVQVSGRFSDYARISDEADRKEHVFHFCPDCGSQVFYTEPTEPDLIVVSVGAFADPSFPPPTESGYDSRRHPWIGLPESVRLLATGGRGPGGFPPPMSASGWALYSWAQVSEWFTRHYGRSDEVSGYDRVVADAEHLVRARAILGRSAGDLAELVS